MFLFPLVVGHAKKLLVAVISVSIDECLINPRLKLMVREVLSFSLSVEVIKSWSGDIKELFWVKVKE